MSKQTINIGASPNDGTGTPLRTSFDYTNQNFTELYTALGGGVGLPGATTQVIFNDGGTNLAGDAGLVYNKTTDALTIGGAVNAASATITGDLTVDTSTLKVDSTNNRVGIGTATPANTFQVIATTGIAADFAGTGAAGFQTIARIRTASASSNGFLIQGNNTTDEIFFNNFYNAALLFGTNNVERYRIASDGVSTWSVAGTTAMTLNSSGLGVGVTPSAWATFKGLQVGTASLAGYAGGSDTLIGANVYFDGAFKYIAANIASSYRQLNGVHQWNTAVTGSANAAITFTQAMTLDASGNLLVGRTTLFAQASRLTIESNSQTTSICGIFNDSRTDAASAINIAFYRNGTKVGSVDCTNAATSYVTSSDYRLKDDVQPLSGGLSRVCALKPSIYKWKINGFNGEGFIAHELAEVVPFAVTGEKDAVNKDGTVNPQGVDLSKVVPILVAAIQELTARVQTLEAR